VLSLIKEKLLYVHTSMARFSKIQREKRNTIDESLYFAFSLGGEGFHVQKIRTTSVQLMELPLIMQKKYTVEESRWNHQPGKSAKRMIVVLVELPAKGGIP
jgi:hypothetical protein